MTAEQFLTLAETLRSYARHSGRDINEANLFVHTVLLRAIHYDAKDARAASAAPKAAKAH